jgi:FAD/FMN-containing dehydrogenase
MDLHNSLQFLLGEKGWLTPPDTKPWERDWLNRIGEEPLGVARPATRDEVSQVLRLCRAAGRMVVPQGGNTGLVGGSVLSKPGGVILSLARLDQISEPDIASCTIEVGAGVVLAHLHESLRNSGFMFPMHLGAEGSAQIGGLIATNAGGSHAFRYGLMQDLVLGLEVVLPDGSIWNGMRRVQKDNGGYQLRKLFCGAEGTLGVVTKAVLKLFPEPIQEVTALLAVRDMDAGCQLATLCRRQAGEFLSALEFFSDFGLEMALAKVANLTFPLQSRAPFYILLEAGAGSPLVPLKEIVSAIIEQALAEGLVSDGVVAASETQRKQLWRLREEQPEGQRLSGPQLKHDISVPPGLMSEFLRRAEKVCQEILPGVRTNAFGHLGDGNVHYNLSPPVERDGFSDLELTFALKLGQLASAMDGSFAAEHGLGRAKVALADQLREPLERSFMAQLKEAIDSAGTLNSGAIVSKLN